MQSPFSYLTWALNQNRERESEKECVYVCVCVRGGGGGREEKRNPPLNYSLHSGRVCLVRKQWLCPHRSLHLSFMVFKLGWLAFSGSLFPAAVSLRFGSPTGISRETLYLGGGLADDSCPTLGLSRLH